MSGYSREEAMRIAAEKVKRKKEQEKREEQEFYERVTSGTPWILFITIVGFCTLMMILTTIEIFVDGETKKIDDSEWKVDRSLYVFGHQSIVSGNGLFVVHFDDWFDYVDGSFEVTYSPIFHTEKWLSYDQEVGNTVVRRQVIRQRTIFTWFPYLQIAMLIPLLTLIFKRQKPWFNFARVGSMVIIFPGILLIMILTLI